MTDCFKNWQECLDHGIQIALAFWVSNSKWVDVFVYNKQWDNWQVVPTSLDTYVVFKFPSPKNTEGGIFSQGIVDHLDPSVSSISVVLIWECLHHQIRLKYTSCQWWFIYAYPKVTSYCRFHWTWLDTIIYPHDIIYITRNRGIVFSCDQAALWMVQSVCLSVCLSVSLSVCRSHLFDYVPIIVSSWNFQELLPMTEVMSMQKVKVRDQRSRSQRSQPNLAVSGR